MRPQQYQNTLNIPISRIYEIDLTTRLSCIIGCEKLFQAILFARKFRGRLLSNSMRMALRIETGGCAPLA